MRYHESDRGKRASELWRDACCLYHLLQINLERYPKGNVIAEAIRAEARFAGWEGKDVYLLL